MENSNNSNNNNNNNYYDDNENSMMNENDENENDEQPFYSSFMKSSSSSSSSSGKTTISSSTSTDPTPLSSTTKKSSLRVLSDNKNNNNMNPYASATTSSSNNNKRSQPPSSSSTKASSGSSATNNTNASVPLANNNNKRNSTTSQLNQIITIPTNSHFDKNAATPTNTTTLQPKTTTTTTSPITPTIPVVLDYIYHDMSFKRSIKDCLRSKVIPCPIVTKLVQTNFYIPPMNDNNDELYPPDTKSSTNNNNDSQQQRTMYKISRFELKISSNVILTQYLNPIKNWNGWGANASSSPFSKTDIDNVSFVELLSKLATTFRFVQLVLEYQEDNEPSFLSPLPNYQQQQQSSSSGNNDDSVTVNRITPSMMMDTEITNIVIQLLRNITCVICSCCERLDSSERTVNDGNGRNSGNSIRTQQQWSSEELYTGPIRSRVANNTNSDNTTNTTNNSYRQGILLQLAYYTIGAMLRFNTYIRTRPFLLPPLWKGLCEIVQAVEEMKKDGETSPSLGAIPSELCLDAIKVLTDQLSDGYQHLILQFDTSTTTRNHATNELSTNDQHILFQLKIMTFLIARLSVFLNAYIPINDDECSNHMTNDLSKNPLNGTLELLFHMNGFASTIEMDKESSNMISGSDCDQFLVTYQSFQSKVNRCLLSWIGFPIRNNNCNTDNSGGPTEAFDIQHDRLKMILETDYTKPSEKSSFASYCQASLYYGLHQFALTALSEILSIHPWIQKNFQTDDIESILWMCETLLFTTVPMLGYQSDVSNNRGACALIDNTLRIICNVLLHCEINYLTDTDNQNRYHQALIYWLSQCSMPVNNAKSQESCIPLTRELLVTLVMMYTICSAEIIRQPDSSIANCAKMSSSIIKLLVHLLFDVRTCTCFRMNLSSVLQRLVKVKNELIVTEVVHQLNRGFVDFQQLYIMPNNNQIKKRKRSSLQKSQGSYTAADVEIIMRTIVLCLPGNTPCSSTRFADDLSKFTNGDSSLSQKSLVSFIIYSTRMILESRHDVQYDDLKAIKSFCKVWNRSNQRRSTNPHYSEYCPLLLLAGKLVSHLACCIVTKCGRKLSDKAFERINNFIQFSTATCMMDASHNAEGNNYPFLALSFEAMKILSILGMTISPATQEGSLDTISNVCREQLFARECWPIQHYAMSSFIKFVSTIPATHKSAVVKFLPSNLHILFQCRLKKELLGASCIESDVVSDSINTWKIHRAESIHSMHRSQVRKPIFRVMNSFSVEPGSYLMTMPTQNGRSAIVIFPPGKHSLDDINIMVGLRNSQDEQDSDDTLRPVVEILRHSIMLQNGGCKFALRQVKK